jgi:hypothetical protein
MLYWRVYARTAAVAVALGGVSWSAGAIPGAGDRVQIEVTGNIKAYCSNSATSVPIDAGDPRQPGSSKFSFTVDCNAPFQYTMQSQNGAMRLVDAPATATRDKIEVPYDIHIRIPLTLGGAIDDTCNSTSIRQGAAITCKLTDSGQKVAIGQQAVTQVSWNGTKSPLMAGHYSDQLTVFITVKL